MDIKGRVVVVTGGASGIGEALCRAFAKTGAREVVVADFNEAGAKEVADECGGVAMNCDVTIEDDIARVVRDTEAKFGRIDIFCSNAGIMHYDNTHVASSPDEHWQRAWDIHVMAHVCAARAVLPSMIERGEGYFVNTASAAGLLSQIGSTTYTVTKHAAIGFAECLAIAHGDDGIRVSVVCPQAVNTPMIDGVEGGVASVDGAIEPEEVAESVMDAIGEERFLVLPHPVVQDYIQRKTSDYERWIKGMRRLRARYAES